VNGGCYRRPGKELNSVSYLDVLEDADLSLKCKDCFRETRIARTITTLRTLDPEEEDSDESSSTNPEIDT
jgi:hypothetical protein